MGGPTEYPDISIKDESLALYALEVKATHRDQHVNNRTKSPESMVKHYNLFKEDEQVQLPIWYATRKVGQSKVFVTLNTDPVLSFELTHLKQPYVDFDLKFIGENYTDEKPRRFRLNAESWDKLGLTEKP